MINNGKYGIYNQDGDMIGAFEIISNEVHNLYGLAKETLKDGPLTPQMLYQIKKLSNGYMSVRPINESPRPKPSMPKDILLIYNPITGTKEIYNTKSPKDIQELTTRYHSTDLKKIAHELGHGDIIQLFQTKQDAHKFAFGVKEQHLKEKAKTWAKDNDYLDHKFLRNLLRGM